MANHIWRVLTVSLLALGCNKSSEATTPGEREQSEGAEHRVQCGKVQCAAGEICCNPSCGICTVPEGMCTQQFCDEGAPDVQAGEPPPSRKLSCDNVRCAEGTHCELVEVQCIRAPCDPVPECRPDAPLDAEPSQGSDK